MGLSVLQAHARKVPHLQVMATFASATQALAYLHAHPVDVLFVDIQMPDLSGLELASILGASVHIIFTTAYAQYAITGFELAAIDYLLKPISLSRFVQACGRAADRLSRSSQQQLPTAQQLFVKSGYDWARIDLAALLYLEADDNYLTFHEPERRTLTRMTLSEAMEKLPAEQFVRVHKSFVISLAKLDKIERHQVVVAGRSLPLSESFRAELLRRFS